MAKSETVKSAIVKETSLYKTLAQMESARVKAVKKGTTLGIDYQRILCSAIVHLAQSHDIRPIRNILETMPEGLRRNAAEAFLDKYATVKFDDDGVIHADKTRKPQLGLALENAWWKAAPQTPYKPFVFVNEVKALIAKAENKFTKGVDKAKGDNLSYADIEALRAVIAPKAPAKKRA